MLERNRVTSRKFSWSVVRQITPVFCIPANTELLDYWKRVDDRLFKIRNCLDITGQRRQLALFSPAIDPRVLINAKAGGLSIDDVLDALTAAVPPYRFTFLVERAKQYASVVQSFGSALQGAIERRDAEELNQLRLTQQRNVLAQTEQVRKWEHAIAARQVEALLARRETLAGHHSYLENLRNTGLNEHEWAERIGRHTATAMRAVESTINLLGGALHLIPQVGSPFAMKYGGDEVGSSADSFAFGARAIGDLANAVASSAAMEASFSRRDQGWGHDIDQTTGSLAQIDKEIAAAELRRDIAERNIELHDLAVQQAQDLADFAHDKFTDLGLYTWMAGTLRQIHRDAFNCALSMARMAEQAYRFERDDDVTALLSGDYWSPVYSGLLAGGGLLVELEQLEKRYIDTTTRDLEIDQSFSLTQLDGAALLDLKQTGSCEFEIPEFAFDLFYPGQYRRRMKSARLSIPCVAGPYTNVSATLSLVGSRIRREPDLDPAKLEEIPLGQAQSIATSTAQNDAGVLSLSFRDERYVPFEGAGAVSTWRLELPANFRQFDYETINDVVLHLAYTAKHDGVLRTNVQEAAAAVQGSISKFLADNSIPRVFSLRSSFSTEYSRLLASPVNTPVPLEIDPRHLPMFLMGSNINVTSASLVLAVRPGADVSGVEFELAAQPVNGFTPSAGLANPPAADVTASFATGLIGQHTFELKEPGALASAAGGTNPLDRDVLADILLYVEYQPA